MQRILPRALVPGDAIAVVAPSGVVDGAKLDRARQRLEAAGFRVKNYGDLFRRRGYLAGGDDQRADELMEAFADADVAAVFPARGGYGVSRLLDRLDYEAIAAHPKVLVGFSDITALHLAIHRHAGLATLHGPNLSDGLGRPEGMTDAATDAYWRAISGQASLPDPATDAGYAVHLPERRRAHLTALAPGVAEGLLTGGNLAVLCGLLGTPYEVETEGRILLLEDDGERPYRVDRFLCQLRLAGKLENLAGVLLGQFTDCEPAGEKPSLSIDEVLEDYFRDLGVPVLSRFPAGHSVDNLTLPLHVRVRVDADAREVRVLENPTTRPG